VGVAFSLGVDDRRLACAIRWRVDFPSRDPAAESVGVVTSLGVRN
jgi:hypothetical protein